MSSKLRAKFFKDIDGKRDMVEITIVGDPNTIIQKVTPDHVRQFPHDWEAYQAGKEEAVVPGTPLTEVPGVDRNAALGLKLKGIRTAEELAALDDGGARSIGMGGITFVKAAKQLVRLKELEKQAEAAEQLASLTADRRARPRKDEPQAAV